MYLSKSNRFFESLSELTVGSPKTIGSFLRPQNTSSNTDLKTNIKSNLVRADSKATAMSIQDFMRLLEESTCVKRNIRNLDASEENPIRGSPKKFELVVRTRFMKKEGMGMTETANAMSRHAAKVDKDYLRREIMIHESNFIDQKQYWSFADVLMHAKNV